MEVKLFRPTSLIHAISLTRLQEDKLQKLRRPLPRPPLLPTPPAKLPLATTNSNRLPSGTNFKQLSLNEMQAYNCDEKFAPRHRCKMQHVYMLKMVTDDARDGPKIEEIMEDEETV